MKIRLWMTAGLALYLCFMHISGSPFVSFGTLSPYLGPKIKKPAGKGIISPNLLDLFNKGKTIDQKGQNRVILYDRRVYKYIYDDDGFVSNEDRIHSAVCDLFRQNGFLNSAGQAYLSDYYDSSRYGSSLLICMEWLEGYKSLAQYDVEALTADDLYTVFYDVAMFLVHLHSFGFIHHDIKPENIMLKKHHGRLSVKIVDFGIAIDLRAKTIEDLKTTIMLDWPALGRCMLDVIARYAGTGQGNVDYLKSMASRLEGGKYVVKDHRSTYAYADGLDETAIADGFRQMFKESLRCAA